MKKNLIFVAFALLYQVSQSKWVSEKLESYRKTQNLQKTSYKEPHDKYGEISIKSEGGLKKMSIESNENANKMFNPKKEKLNELRRLRKSRSNGTAETANKDIKKLSNFAYDSKFIAQSRSNENMTDENLEEKNSKIKSKEKLNNNSSREYMFNLDSLSLQGDLSEDSKVTDSSSGDQNLTADSRDQSKKNQFRHLWGQDRLIHSYRSSSMHKKPFWYSSYHFPRAKVTVAGLNIPWFRLRSTFTYQVNIDKEPVSLSKSQNNSKILNNTLQTSTTPDPIEIRLTNISNITEHIITPINRTNLPLETPLVFQSRSPHWPNFHKNMDYQVSEKALIVYKSVRLATKTECDETEITTVHSKMDARTARSVAQTTTHVHLNENAISRQYENEPTSESTRRIPKSGGNVEVTSVHDDTSTNIEQQNVTPWIFMTTPTPLREPQWPPWPQWLNEPLQKYKNEYNGSYVLNLNTANINFNNEESVTLSPVRFNSRQTKTTSEESERFFDIASSYAGLTENIAALIPVTTGISYVATTAETNNYSHKIVEKSHYSENSSNVLSNLKNMVRCTQGCPLTPEFNPVCGTDDITYTNPGRLLCLQFCGLDVKVKKYQPCTSTFKLREYPNMINLFLNTAVESLTSNIRKANASAPARVTSSHQSSSRATVKGNYVSTTSPTTVFYVKYDSFSINDEDEDATEAKPVIEAPNKQMPPQYTLFTDTMVVTPMSVNKYIEKLKDLINFNSNFNKNYDSQSTTTNGPSNQFEDVTYSSKKVESNLAALNNMLKHSGTKHVHSVTHSSRDIATKRFTVTRAIKDVSTKKFNINFPKNLRKSSIIKNNGILRQGIPFVDAIDNVDEPSINGRRFVESPFVDVPYNSGEYVSPEENTIDIFQENQKDSDDPGDDIDSKFWRYHSDKEEYNHVEENKVEEKKHTAKQ